jgi:signal transduction histidine kinase
VINGDFIVKADRNMICTVLRNLLGNAIKFTPLNGTINVNITLNNENYEISVTDTGTGISDEELSRLFRIEHKQSKPGTENEKGTGLGLILCREFVEKHGGKIWAESEAGKGSRFVFTLPAGYSI